MLGADLWSVSDPRVFVTAPDNPEEGRAFVWARTQWFERMTSDTGAVEFSPMSGMDEHDLREWLSGQGEDRTELDNEFSRVVREEFLEQNPLYPESPELSNQE
ncbi:MAG TPA: hypothetical protein VMR52_04095 [Dehalococcoidia bacterium]|nr:hypothetical protein [Dehalococcoidia bacterium]